MALVQNEISEYLHQKADRLHIPLSGVFEVSPVCNMDCRMCYVRKTPAEVAEEGGLLELGDWIALAKEAKEQGTLFLLLTGGEPFLRPDFRTLYSELHGMGFVISVNSNGTLIDADTVAWLKEMPPSRINITLYGADNNTYENLCGNPNGFTDTVRAIRLLKEAGIAVKLSASITRYNVRDLERMVAFSSEHDLVLEATPYMFPPVRKEGFSAERFERFSPEETWAVQEKIIRLQFGENYFQEQCGSFCKKELELREEILQNPQSKGLGIQCRAGSSTYWITWDGKMMPCGMMSEPVVFPLKTGFRQAWEDLKEKTDRIILPTECNNCSKKEICNTCAAMVFAESGLYDRKPGYRCRMAMAQYGTCLDRMAEKLEGK